MLQLLPGLVLFIYCIFSFCRECKLDRERYLEQDRLGDEHIMREIEKFKSNTSARNVRAK